MAQTNQYVTGNQADTLEYLLNDAMRTMIRHPAEWPQPMLDQAVTDMWGGFWIAVDPVGFR